MTMDPSKKLALDVSGIYSIRNKISGERYIGCSIRIISRIKNHKRYLMKGGHDNSHLQRAWDNYGTENFEFCVIQYCAEKDLAVREQHWIRHFNSYLAGYNQTPGGDFSPALIPEIAAKISESKLGKVYGKDHRSAISASLTGRALSEEHKKHISISGRGKTRSQKAKDNIRASHSSPEFKLKQSKASREAQSRPEVRAKKSAAMRGKGFTSEHLTALRLAMSLPETRAKISISLRGRKPSQEARVNHFAAMQRPEVRERISIALLGRKHTKESCQKISDALKGRTFSVEHLDKLADAKRGDRNPMRRPEVVASKLAAQQFNRQQLGGFFA